MGLGAMYEDGVDNLREGVWLRKLRKIRAWLNQIIPCLFASASRGVA